MNSPLITLDGKLEFNLVFDTFGVCEYEFGLDDGISPYVSLRYCSENNNLSINNIFSGTCDSTLIKGITKRTLDLFLSEFDINSISFRDVYEINTQEIVKSVDSSTFNLLNIANLGNSAFLKTLSYLGFNKIESDFDYYDDNFFLDSLTGYRK